VKLFALLFAAAALPLAAADLSGAWKVQGEVAGNPVIATCTIKQEDNKLSGSCKGELGDSPVKGEVASEEKKVKWEYEVEYMGTKYTLVYAGKLESDNDISGTIDAGVATGGFTAKRDSK